VFFDIAGQNRPEFGIVLGVRRHDTAFRGETCLAAQSANMFAQSKKGQKSRVEPHNAAYFKRCGARTVAVSGRKRVGKAENPSLSVAFRRFAYEKFF